MTWFHYILQVNIYLIVFYMFYRLLLHRETWFTLNRIYLLASGCLSLCLPFVRLEWLSTQPVTKSIYAGVENFNTFIIEAGEPTAQGMHWGEFIAGAYVTGVAASLAIFLWRLQITRKGLRSFEDNAAFTFFRRTVVGADLPERDTVELHEQVHMRQLHSLDIVFFECIRIVNWFNPAVYFLISSVRDNHEYLADESAAAFKGDKHAYSMLLLTQAFAVQQKDLASAFFSGPMIKKRIFMLTRERSRRAAMLKYGLLAPVFMLLLMLSSSTIRKNEEIRNFAAKVDLDAAGTVSDVLNGTDEALVLDTLSSGPVSTRIVRFPPPAIIDGDDGQHAISTVRSEEVMLTEPSSAEPIAAVQPLEEQPEYPGGMTAFYKYLSGALKYPKEAAKNNITGKVNVTFTVTAEGAVEDVQVRDRLGYGLDEEAIRVISNSAQWQPARKNGHAVASAYNVGILFRLAGQEVAEDQPASSGLTGAPAGSGNEPARTPAITVRKVKGEQLSAKPLVVLDGEVMQGVAAEQVLATLNQNTIKEIRVLKDAAATTSYGTRAADGVILVTTFKGAGNKPGSNSKLKQ